MIPEVPSNPQLTLDFFVHMNQKISIAIYFYARYNIEPETKPDRPYIVKQFSRGPHHYLAVIDQITNKVKTRFFFEKVRFNLPKDICKIYNFTKEEPIFQ